MGKFVQVAAVFVVQAVLAEMARRYGNKLR